MQIQPTYYVTHPDGSFSAADPQPSMEAKRERCAMSENEPLRRGVDGVCTRSTCECEREGLGDQCVWLRPTDAELERRIGEPHIDGWPLYSGLPPAA